MICCYYFDCEFKCKVGDWLWVARAHANSHKLAGRPTDSARYNNRRMRNCECEYFFYDYTYFQRNQFSFFFLIFPVHFLSLSLPYYSIGLCVHYGLCIRPGISGCSCVRAQKTVLLVGRLRMRWSEIRFSRFSATIFSVFAESGENRQNVHSHRRHHHHHRCYCLLTPPASIVADVGVTYRYREPGRLNETVHSSPFSFRLACACLACTAHIIHSIRTVYLMRNWITHR